VLWLWLWLSVMLCVDYGRRNYSPVAFLGVYPADVTPERTRSS
jgi:hypothetical protein